MPLRGNRSTMCMKTATYRINIQIRFPSFQNRIRDGHRMGPGSEPNRREKNLLEHIDARIPIVEIRSAVKGGVVWRVVISLCTVDPDRCPVEGHRRERPELRRQSERSVVIISKKGRDAVDRR